MWQIITDLHYGFTQRSQRKRSKGRKDYRCGSRRCSVPCKKALRTVAIAASLREIFGVEKTKPEVP